MAMEANVTHKPSKNLYHDDIFDAAYLVLFNIESLLIILGNLLVITVILRYLLLLLKLQTFMAAYLCIFCSIVLRNVTSFVNIVWYR